MSNKNIAIDGPAGAGKSTIAKRIAKELGSIYVDTGAMYRAMALYLIRQNIDPKNTLKLEEACRVAEISLDYVDGIQQVLLFGENVNDYIRTEEVSHMASVSSANKKVREKLVELQQALAKEKPVVMDGRDICTVVLPDAAVKIYLTASSSVRAKRRYDEMIAKGEECDLDEIEKDIIERDYRDMHRENSPLVKALDATEVDTSDMTIDEVCSTIIGIAKEKFA